MTIAVANRPQIGIRAAAESHKPGAFMYAIAFDMDTESLQQHYGSPSYNNAYADIRNLLTKKHGFMWQQGSVYFGGETVNAVGCVLAVVDLAATFSWFSLSVRDIRMLRIEEFNDLMPAVQKGAGGGLG